MLFGTTKNEKTISNVMKKLKWYNQAFFVRNCYLSFDLSKVDKEINEWNLPSFYMFCSITVIQESNSSSMIASRKSNQWISLRAYLTCRPVFAGKFENEIFMLWPWCEWHCLFPILSHTICFDNDRNEIKVWFRIYCKTHDPC